MLKPFPHPARDWSRLRHQVEYAKAHCAYLGGRPMPLFHYIGDDQATIKLSQAVQTGQAGLVQDFNRLGLTMRLSYPQVICLTHGDTEHSFSLGHLSAFLMGLQMTTTLAGGLKAVQACLNLESDLLNG